MVLEAAEPRRTLSGEGLEIGDRVRHRHWGPGTVVQVDGAGDRAEVLVDFDEQGRKRLLLAWAPLERM
jgi:DNA helicase-2/ATP-dependent DNA helicase PcrA